MPLVPPPLSALRAPLGVPLEWARERADSWAVASQHRSRRNAMIAATRLAQRRVDAQSVETYVLERATPAEDAAHA